MALALRYHKLVWLAALGLAVHLAMLWRYEVHRRAAMVDAARRLGGRVSSLTFLWTEEFRIDFQKAPDSEVMCRELAIVNRRGPFRSISIAVRARDITPEGVARLRECLDRCDLIYVADAE
jgi:hypothetical protein